LPANAEKVPLCGLALVTIGEFIVPSMTQGAKLPVSNPPFTISPLSHVVLGEATSTYLASLGMPLVKTLTRAGPAGKLFSGAESKEVLDHPAIGSTGRKATWLLSIERNWTTG